MILLKSNPDTQLQNEKNEFVEKFVELMYDLNLYNYEMKTYVLDLYNKTDYGYEARIYTVAGLCYENIETNKQYIQQHLKCMWIMEYETFGEYAKVKIVLSPIDTEYKFVNPKIKPYQFYLGLDFNLNPIINKNNVLDCMFLIAGATGSGKTRYLYMVLLSWILNCNPNEVELYICDIAKDEYNNFEYVKHVKSYCNDLESLYWMLKYVHVRMMKRKTVLSECRKQGTATNITEYNKISKSKMSYIYVFIDEFASLVPNGNDSKEIKSLKEAILDMLNNIARTGRSYGVFNILSLQKTTKEEMGKSVLKNMSAVRISFRANDSTSSEVIMEDRSAVGIPKRYAVYSQNGGTKKDFFFAPCLETSDLNQFLEPYIDRNKKMLDCKKEVLSLEKPKVEDVKVKVSKKKVNDPKHHKAIDTSSVKRSDYNVPVLNKIPKKGDDFIDN